MSNSEYEIHILREGYLGADNKHLCCICYLKGPKNILVNTGGAWEAEIIEKILHGGLIDKSSLDYVICTNGKPDQIGNLNLFPSATFLVGHDIQMCDSFIDHKFQEKIPFEIDSKVSIVPTPGRSLTDLTVFIHDGEGKITAIVGDLIMTERELIDDRCCDNWPLWGREEMLHHRMKVLKKADVILPGRGAPFKVARQHMDPCVIFP